VTPLNTHERLSFSIRNHCTLIHKFHGRTEVKKPPQHRDIAEKASHHFKKASIPIKIYLKSFAILEKASIFLKQSSKIVEIFIKAPHSKQKPPFL
jgi:hypothetical protein